MKHVDRHIILEHTIVAIMLLIVVACGEKPSEVTKVDKEPTIYPDYSGVTVPVNIAPLNFMVREDQSSAIYVVAKGNGEEIVADCTREEAIFDIRDWKKLLSSNAGSDITITVDVKTEGQWKEYKPFSIRISSDSIDSYLTYRLIEPDYEVFSRLQIKERCVEDFSERSICDYKSVGNRCMNCHTYSNQDPNLSFLYVRGKGGGMMLNQNGNIRKLNVKASDMVSGAVYAQFSPNGRWIVFSTNKIIPAFHAAPSKRLEVFDTKSDIYIADIVNNKIISNPILEDSTRLETFPTFSPDGKSIYYCSAERLPMVSNLDSLQYDLCRISFDEATGVVGDHREVIVSSQKNEKKSVCHPRVSPDGKYLLYTVANYGTFPIWHPESDLQMMELGSGETDTLGVVNSAKSDTYHSWSSNSRWFVFASKRDDGMYGKPYFCHVDERGKASKPFLLPQERATFYDKNLKSFNAPELGKGALPFTAEDIAKAFKKTTAESFSFYSK